MRNTVIVACGILAGAIAVHLRAQAPLNAYDDVWPSWAPDGRRIAFSSTRDGDHEIYVMNADGTEPRRLTSTPGRDAHPYWSPDGTKIVFQSPREDGHTRIFVMNADGSGQRALTSNQGFCGVPVWSPDGRRIVYQCTGDLERTSTDRPWKLFAIDAAGGGARQLTHGTGNDQVPHWSPDGKRLLFYSDRSGTDQLYTMDAAGGAAVLLTKTSAANRTASWSPDGAWIAFQSERSGRPSDIHRMRADGGDAVRLTTSGTEHGVPYFSPDGGTIAFQARSGGSWRIWLMNADGSNQRALGGAAGGELILVSLSGAGGVVLVVPDTGAIVSVMPVAKNPHEIAVSRAGTRAYVATVGDAPGAASSGSANVVSVVDLVTRRSRTPLSLGKYERPHDVRISADGSTLWVACAPARAILELDAASGALRREWKTNADGGWFVAVTPDARKIYVPHLEAKRVTVIDRERGRVSTVLEGGAQSGIDVAPDGRSVWIIDHERQRINVVDPQTDRIAASLPLSSPDFGRLRFTPDGRRVVLVQGRTLRLIDTATRRELGTVELPYPGKVVDVSATSDRAAVSHPSDDQISIVDLDARRVLTSIRVGKTPDGVAWVR